MPPHWKYSFRVCVPGVEVECEGSELGYVHQTCHEISSKLEATFTCLW
jgi:hypothetical protein